MSVPRPLAVTTRPIDELGAWLVMCEALGIGVVDRGCGQFELTVPRGVAVPEPPSTPFRPAPRA